MDAVLVGILIGVISSFAALILEYRTGWFAGRQPKRQLSIIARDEADLSAQGKFPGLKISAVVTTPTGDEIVERPMVLSFVIRNTGRADLMPDDFVEPIKITLENGVWRVCYLESASDAGIKPKLTFDKGPGDHDTLSIEPGLLNADEQFTVSAVVDLQRGNKVHYQPSARIRGVKLQTVSYEQYIQQVARSQLTLRTTFLIVLAAVLFAASAAIALRFFLEHIPIATGQTTLVIDDEAIYVQADPTKLLEFADEGAELDQRLDTVQMWPLHLSSYQSSGMGLGADPHCGIARQRTLSPACGYEWH